MEITAKLAMNLKRYLPDETNGVIVKQFPQESLTVGELLNEMGIPPEDVMIIRVSDIIIWKTGEASDYELHDGETAEIFPHYIGGG